MPKRIPHTPGPWSVPHFARPEIDCDCGYVLAEGYMGAVALIYHDGAAEDCPPLEEASANARLISMAPSLYEYVAQAAEGGCPRAQALIAELGSMERVM